MRRFEKFLTIFAIFDICVALGFFAFVGFSVFTTPEEVDSAISSADNAGIQADKNILGDVEITIPADLLTLGLDDTTDNSEYIDTIIAQAKTQGFKSVEKLPDGSLKYKIGRKEYKTFIEEYRQITSDSIAELYGENGFQSVKGITHNDDFSKITVTVDKEQYSNSFDSMVKMSVGLMCRMYQVYDVDAPQKVVVEIKDNITGDIIEKETYPED